MPNNEKIDLGTKLEYRKEPIPEGQEIPKEVLEKIPSIRIPNNGVGDIHKSSFKDEEEPKEED